VIQLNPAQIATIQLAISNRIDHLKSIGVQGNDPLIASCDDALKAINSAI
jgi:hypothetical protein